MSETITAQPVLKPDKVPPANDGHVRDSLTPDERLMRKAVARCLKAQLAEVHSKVESGQKTDAVPASTKKWDQQVMKETRPVWFGLFKKGGDKALKNIRRFPKYARKMAVLSWAELEASERVEVKGYNPDQPRVPAGSPEGGQFVEEGGSGGGSTNDRVKEDVDNPETWPKAKLPDQGVVDLWHVTGDVENVFSIQREGYIAQRNSSMGDPVNTNRVFFATNREQADSIRSQLSQGGESNPAIIHLRIPARLLNELDPRVDIGMPESSIVVKPNKRILTGGLVGVITDTPEKLPSEIRERIEKATHPSIVIPPWIEDPDVLDALEKEMFKFAHSINQTTADMLRETLIQGMEEGDTISQMANSISELSDEWVEGWRAEMIARTETARAFTTGHIEAWKSTGVVDRKVWVAAGDACFTADSLVLVFEGGEIVRRRMDQIKTGDLVLGQSGKPCKVEAISVKDYSGVLVRGYGFNATPDHVFLTATGKWRPIGEYATKAFFRRFFDFLVGQAKNFPTAFFKVARLSFVLCRRSRSAVPVNTIALKNKRDAGDNKVHDPLAIQRNLFFEPNVSRTKYICNGLLNVSSTFVSLPSCKVAFERTINMLSARTFNSMGWVFQNLFSAISAGINNFIFSPCASIAQHFYAVIGGRTFAGAEFRVSSFLEDLPAPSALAVNIRGNSRVFSHGNAMALVTAKLFRPQIMFVNAKQLAANLTLCILTTGKATTSLATKLCAFFFQHVIGRNKIFSTNRAFDCFHAPIIPYLRLLSKPFLGKVYDIKVADEHCFTLACGLIAHNCPFCQQMNGTVVELDEPFFKQGEEQEADWKGEEIVMGHDYSDVNGPPLHPNCRCVLVAELSEEKMINKQMESIQT